MCQLSDLNKEFYEHIGEKYSDEPVPLMVERRAQFMAYIISEVVEYGNAANLITQIDALTDAMYFIVDAFVEMGLDPFPFYEEVHKSNMTKVWDDGKVRWDYTVLPPKLLKPAKWEPPDIAKILGYKET